MPVKSIRKYKELMQAVNVLLFVRGPNIRSRKHLRSHVLLLVFIETFKLLEIKSEFSVNK